jgi:hypothetical protein
MDAIPNRSAAGHGEQFCVVSCQGGGVAYYWSVLDWRSRDAIGFRGFSAKFEPSPIAREVEDFTVAGPLIGCLFDLEDRAEVQAIEMGGSVGAPPVPFDAKLLVAPAPQVSPVGHGPDGAILSITNESEGATVATVANIRLDGNWIFAILVAAIPAVAVNGGPALAAALMDSSSAGNLVVTITTPIGTVAVNKPFTTAPGLPAADG